MDDDDKYSEEKEYRLFAPHSIELNIARVDRSVCFLANFYRVMYFQKV